jgi:glycerate-2-kinase
MIIKNEMDLLSQGNIEGRKIVLDIIKYALINIDSYKLTKEKVHIIEDKYLIVDNLVYDLSKIENIYVIGAGKGSYSIAKALEDILGDRIKEGIIIEKKGIGKRMKKIKVIEGGHPIPDEDGMEGAIEIVKIAKNATEKDLLFACITGGCSALMTLPTPGISLEDVKITTDLLLKCGADIQEINAVRNHISSISGGRLATYVHPAELISFIVVDEVRGFPWGPTVPDYTTLSDAIHVLKKYNLWNKIPENVRKHFEKADPTQETPKIEDFKRMNIKAHNIVLANSETVCKAAEKKAKELGFNTMILSTVIEGESREVGIALAGIAKEVEKNGIPMKPPCVFIVGGETTVRINGEAGEGGRNQEFALGAALKISGSKNIVVASVGTDGTDGPTDIAGGIVDGYTLKRAEEKGIDVFKELMKHNSSYVFRQLNDAIFTGPTGTNVMDLRILCITSTI